MYNLQNLINHLNTELTYPVSFCRVIQPALAPDPKIYVGYKAVEAEPGGALGEGQTEDYYIQFSENLSQYFQVQLTCSVSTFHSVWEEVYEKTAGWVPLEQEKDYSSVMHSGGGIMGLDNGNIWWVDTWRTDFPRANPI
jgi:hypothetical protein